jgi:hypothetical protein
VAEENIDNTVNGTGPFNTKIPGLGDAADIQAALRLYHYGSYTYDAAAPEPEDVLPYSVAGHLQKLTDDLADEVENREDADAAEVVARNAAIAAHNAQTINVHGIANTENLASQAYVINALEGAAAEYPNLAGDGLEWNGIDERFDLDPSLLNNNTVVVKTSDFTLDPLDVNKTIFLQMSSPTNLSIPLNSAVNIPVGYKYNLVEIGSAKTTFVPASGVTVGSKNSQLFLDGTYSKGTLVKIATDSWVLYGDVYEGVAVPTPTPTPVAPTPVAPTPVAPTPVAPTPVAPTPVAPTPVAPTPVAPTPVAPTPVAPTPVAPTPVAPTPVAPTPVPPLEEWTATGCYNGVAYAGAGNTESEALADLYAQVPDATNVSTTNQQPVTLPDCAIGTWTATGCYNGVAYAGAGNTESEALADLYDQVPDATNVSTTDQEPVTLPDCSTGTSGVWYTFCGNVSAGYDPGTVVGPVFDPSLTCSQALAQQTSFGEIGSGWNCASGTSASSSVPAANCGATPTPVAPTPVAPTPVAPTPVAPTPVAPTPVNPCNPDWSLIPQSQCAACGLVWSQEFGECISVSPTPVAPTPVAPTPVAPTPVAPTPVAPAPPVPTPVAPVNICADPSILNQSQCQGCGYYYSTQFGECSSTPWDTPTPVAPPSFPFFPPFFPPFFAPTPVAPTPVAPTPVAPTPVAPTPVAPTPVAPTPVAPIPVAPTPVAPTPVAECNGCIRNYCYEPCPSCCNGQCGC